MVRTHMMVWICILCLMYSVCTDAAKGNPAETDLLQLQRQFNEFKIRQEAGEKLSFDRIKRLEDLVSSQSEIIREQEDKLSSVELKLKTNKRLILDNDLVESGRVAFSAYLDHDLDSATYQQKIVFNQANYNDGEFYNVSTGVFSAPSSGVYLFIYFIGNRHAREVDAELVVNGVKQNEAVAEGIQNAHDTQGGNSAVLKLTVGDMVWIDTTLGSHVEGQWRFSSFTGAMLYPIY